MEAALENFSNHDDLNQEKKQFETEMQAMREVKEIPEEETRGVIEIQYIPSRDEKGQGVGASLLRGKLNHPIRKDFTVQLSPDKKDFLSTGGMIPKIKSIKKNDVSGAYTINTQNGGEYLFYPSAKPRTREEKEDLVLAIEPKTIVIQKITPTARGEKVALTLKGVLRPGQEIEASDGRKIKIISIEEVPGAGDRIITSEGSYWLEEEKLGRLAEAVVAGAGKRHRQEGERLETLLAPLPRSSEPGVQFSSGEIPVLRLPKKTPPKE